VGRITTLGFDFPMPGELPRGNWAGGGWTIRIKSSWKPRILELLAGWTYPVTKESIYPPIECAKAAVNEAARQAASTL